MAVFNANNTEWKSGKYSLFFGQESGLYDSIHMQYPNLFELYQQQKAQDWREDEVDLTQDRMDFTTCTKSNYDIMIKTLAYQWELDSVASRTIAPLFAPFVSCSELWAYLSKISEIEVLHALTYSEIVRQATPNVQEAISLAMESQQVLTRASKVVTVFNELQKMGARLILGEVERDAPEVKRAVILGIIALYALERIEFMSSFAATFALAELGIFQGVAKLVAKIAADEQLHFAGDEEIIRILKREEPEAFAECLDEAKEILDDVRAAEHEWNEYIFSEGRALVGLNKAILDDWVDFGTQGAYDLIGLEVPFTRVEENPLPWMAHWLDIDMIQVAAQESTTVNYMLNSVVDDLGDDELEF